MSRIEDRMGISYRQLDHWAREGYLKPQSDHGVQRHWPEAEIRIARMMSRLVAIGMTPGAASVYARSAVLDNAVMLIELRNGRMRVSGAFARSLRAHLERRYAQRNAQRYLGASEQEEAC